jgi:hypothetical protein
MERIRQFGARMDEKRKKYEFFRPSGAPCGPCSGQYAAWDRAVSARRPDSYLQFLRESLGDFQCF